MWYIWLNKCTSKVHWGGQTWNFFSGNKCASKSLFFKSKLSLRLTLALCSCVWYRFCADRKTEWFILNFVSVTCWKCCSVGGSTAPWGSWQRWGHPEHISWLFLEDGPATFYQPLSSPTGCPQCECWQFPPTPSTDTDQTLEEKLTGLGTECAWSRILIIYERNYYIELAFKAASIWFETIWHYTRLLCKKSYYVLWGQKKEQQKKKNMNRCGLE